MSQIDDELTLLKQKIAILEEQKRIKDEKEAEKKINPLKIIKGILDEKKKLRNVLDHSPKTQGGRPYKLKEFPMDSGEWQWFCDQNDKVSYLEPIFNMLKNIDERLQNLEKKDNSINTIEELFNQTT